LKKYGFNLPTRIEFKTGLLKKSGEIAREITAGRKAFVVTDPGVKKAGIAEQVVSSLAEVNFECFIFEKVRPNPKDTDCEAGGAEARRFNADIIVAVGGGSVIDSAKAIALLQVYGGTLASYEGEGTVPGAVTPLVCVPTTAGTGSEVTRSAVITDTKRKFKMSVKDVMLAPRLALADPETTYSLPTGLTASTGMDALVHAIEAYTCREANPFSDALALAAIERIYPALPAVVRDGSNKQARDDMMIGSVMAGIAFSHSDVGAVHCLAEAIGSLYDTPHGTANSVFLPAVTAFNAEADPRRHARIAMACGLDTGQLKAEEASRLLVDKLAELSFGVGIPRFSNLEGVDPKDFEYLAEISKINGSTPSNCRSISKKDYYKILQDCYKS